MSKAQVLNFTDRAYGKRSRWESYKKITNASIDKQITLKRDYIYKIEITDLEKGFQAFYYVYFSILKHVDVQDRLAQYMRYASTFEYNDPKCITQRSRYIYNNEVKRIK